MVTLELAIGVVAATLVAAFLVSLTLLGVAQAACAETASQVARQTARGDDVAVREARGRAPADATITVTREASGVAVRVVAPFRLLALPATQLAADAWAAYEPGIGP
ncbi:MAG: TadE family type IV pilus minor pilin [Arachnia sp.]